MDPIASPLAPPAKARIPIEVLAIATMNATSCLEILGWRRVRVSRSYDPHRAAGCGLVFWGPLAELSVCAAGAATGGEFELASCCRVAD